MSLMFWTNSDVDIFMTGMIAYVTHDDLHDTRLWVGTMGRRSCKVQRHDRVVSSVVTGKEHDAKNQAISSRSR